MGPPYLDDNFNLLGVKAGMDIAEEEFREAVADACESETLKGGNPEETVDDIN
jgi:hypothetical protein